MYNKSNYDHIFYRMKKNVPKNKILFYLVTVLKLYPLFFLSHSAGFQSMLIINISPYHIILQLCHLVQL